MEKSTNPHLREQNSVFFNHLENEGITLVCISNNRLSAPLAFFLGNWRFEHAKDKYERPLQPVSVQVFVPKGEKDEKRPSQPLLLS